MILRIRTNDDLDKLLKQGKSAAWVVANDKEKEIKQVEIYQFDGKRVLKGVYEPKKSTRRKEDNRLIVAFKNGAIQSANLKWKGQNPINYVAIEKPAAVLHIVLNGKKIQVAEKDLDTKMKWEDAKKACSKLGNGWRSPTIDELSAMYEQLHQKGLGNFQKSSYWSSTEYDFGYAWFFDFSNGTAYYNFYENVFKFNSLYVRAVRAF
jgi:hypothetical protein